MRKKRYRPKRFLKMMQVAFLKVTKRQKSQVTEIPDQTGRPRTDKRGGEEISY